jgi:hypothetical protein
MKPSKATDKPKKNIANHKKFAYFDNRMKYNLQ